MNRRILAFIIPALMGAVLFLLIAGCSSGGDAPRDPASSPTPGQTPIFAQGEIIVRLKDGCTPGRVISLTGGSLKGTRTMGGMNYALISLPSGQEVESALKALENEESIDYGQPNYLYHATLTPNDPEFSGRQYCHQRMSSEKAWDVTTGNGSVIVAIVDTGVDGTHPEFSGRMVDGYDFVQNRPITGAESPDENGHGTHVAGIAAATGNNSKGVAGLNWGCRIMPVRVMDSSGSGSDWAVAGGIQFAAENGAKVINLSLGGKGYSQEIQDAINMSLEMEVTVVASMGNDYSRGLNYPGACQGVIAVGSSNAADLASIFSTRGDHISVAAPGEEIYSTYPLEFGQYKTMSGTSMASPQVTGLASLLLGQNPSWPPSMVRSHLENTAIDLGAPGFDDSFGFGRIDAFNAITSPGLDKYGSLAINVLQLGVPVSGADVVITDSQGNTAATTRTDYQGKAAFYHLKAGDYKASTFYNGTYGETVPVTVLPGSTASGEISL
jgi:thermitase